MTKLSKSLLPYADDISDEAAAVLTEFLFQLADQCEFKYGAKINRHADAMQAARIDSADPDLASRQWRLPV